MDKELKIIYGIWIFTIASSVIFLPLISSSPDLIDNIVSYYKFDEQDITGSGTIYDELGINNATNIGASNITGKINTAYSFDGGNDRIVKTSPAGLPSGNEAFTVAFWVYWLGDGIRDRSAVYEWGTNSADDQNAGFIGDSDIIAEAQRNKFVHYFYANDLPSLTSIPINTWTHIAVTYDGTTRKIYINGTLDNSDTPGPVTVAVIDLIFGRNTVGTDYWMKGKIDEPGIWDVAKNSTEISELYNSHAGNQYPFAVDTCTCAGLNNNWEIDMSDNCEITEACDLGTGTLSFTGAGWCKCNASVDTTNLGDPGSSGILYIQDSCIITIN